ncbi:MAG: hypothetical protein KAG53_04940 [Endozoicomonadaceae bacterium]|nr:hypothetical protein [Endozoicomonadaceae bacterium]
MAIEYIESKHCFKLSFNDAFTYVKEHGGSTIEAVIAWMFKRTVTKIVAQAYVSHTPMTTLSKQFGTLLSARTTKSTTEIPSKTTEIPSNDGINLNSLKIQKHELKQKHDAALKTIQDLKDSQASTEFITSSLNTQLSSKKSELSNSDKSNKNGIKSKELCDKLSHLSKEKDRLLNALSKQAADKLSDNNPNIADLSNLNRPTKLADKINDIYGNQWADALGGAMDDLETTTQSKQILEAAEQPFITHIMDAMKAADKKVKCYINDQKYKQDNTKINLLKTAIDNKDHNKDITHNDLIIWTDSILQIGKYLNNNPNKLTEIIDLITNNVIEEGNYKIPLTALKQFVSSLVNSMIFMNLNSPPVVFVWPSPGDKFNKDCCKEYTKKGGIIDYVTWPALYLYLDGPLLNKATTQCRES